MSKKSTSTGAMGKRLRTEKFHGLAQTLLEWRRDPVIRKMDADPDDKGKILGFVKGLRLSARVAYLVRDILSGENVEVSWGHLVDDKWESCSPECDIVIHQPGHIQRWNGDGGANPIMDFKFIECSKALAVISCKSFAKEVDKGYCREFSKYGLKDILLFAECCPPNKVTSLKTQALANGYSGFFYLYTLDGFTVNQDETVYLEFVEAIKTLVNPPRRRGRPKGSSTKKK